MPRLLTAALILTTAVSAPALAQHGPWGRGDSMFGPSRWNTPRAEARRSDEGKVIVDRFVAEGEAASQLARGAIAVSPVAMPGEAVSLAADRWSATYEAAVIDALSRSGYDTAQRDSAGGQVAEVSLTRSEVQPQEVRRNPVSGEAMVGVSNHGSMMGLGINVDLSKPRAALVATQLSVRIRDRVSQAVLWEGRATISTRSGDERWGEGEVAARLADSLFAGFPALPD